MEARGVRCERRFRIRRGGQRLVVDLHLLGRILGEVAVLREDRHDRLAGVADLAGGQHRQLRRPIARHARGGANRPEVAVEIAGGHHRGDAGGARRRADVDARDARMAFVAAAERGVQRAGPPEIVHVAAPAGEEARVLAALHAGPDEAGPQLRRRRPGFDGILHRRWRCAAARTARTTWS